MADDVRAENDEVTRLRNRLERERRTRMEAESIAERALRDLYEKQQALQKEIDDRRGLEEKFRQVQKMEAVGRLAGGVTHDFNNLLTVIIGTSELILAEFQQDPSTRGLIEEVRRAGERAAALTRQLLAFSRKQVLAPVVLNLNALVIDLERMLGRTLGEDIQVTLALEPAPHLIKADRGQIEQVLMNLVFNARDAMPEGGTLVIETRNVDLSESDVQSRAEIQPGPYALLVVTDTGSGMDAHTMAHLFEPFFTTKGAGKGTGLGLATVYGIVKQSGGYIYVESAPGRGTTFKIYLPQAEETLAEGWKPDNDTTLARGGTETILLVEDERAVRSLARRVLQARGYTVLEAENGDEAFFLCEQYAWPVHLILTDVILPKMTGRLVAERLKLLRPALKLLFMSGYADDALSHHGVLDAGTALLQKPFTPNGLARKVREVLDAPA
jgi:signal transduction histidine kinase/CheY-like chemotaxis protein